MYLFYGDRIIRVAGAYCPDITVRSWPLFLVDPIVSIPLKCICLPGH